MLPCGLPYKPHSVACNHACARVGLRHKPCASVCHDRRGAPAWSELLEFWALFWSILDHYGCRVWAEKSGPSTESFCWKLTQAMDESSKLLDFCSWYDTKLEWSFIFINLKMVSNSRQAESWRIVWKLHGNWILHWRDSDFLPCRNSLGIENLYLAFIIIIFNFYIYDYMII